MLGEDNPIKLYGQVDLYEDEFRISLCGDGGSKDWSDGDGEVVRINGSLFGGVVSEYCRLPPDPSCLSRYDPTDPRLHLDAGGHR